MSKCVSVFPDDEDDYDADCEDIDSKLMPPPPPPTVTAPSAQTPGERGREMDPGLIDPKGGDHLTFHTSTKDQNVLAQLLY